MATGVKVTMIGAGSATFAAGIVRDLCVTPELHGSHVALVDVNERRLEMIDRMARRLSGELDADLSFSKTTDRAEALQGADFVINTAQVGGHDWTEAQRAVAEKHARSSRCRVGSRSCRSSTRWSTTWRGSTR